MKYLFIGGSKDGERMEVKRGVSCVEYPVLDALSITQDSLEIAIKGGLAVTDPIYKKESYRLKSFDASTNKLIEDKFSGHTSVKCKSFDMFVFDELSLADATEMLIDNYRKQK